MQSKTAAPCDPWSGSCCAAENQAAVGRAYRGTALYEYPTSTAPTNSETRMSKTPNSPSRLTVLAGQMASASTRSQGQGRDGIAFKRYGRLAVNPYRDVAQEGDAVELPLEIRRKDVPRGEMGGRAIVPER